MVMKTKVTVDHYPPPPSPYPGKEMPSSRGMLYPGLWVWVLGLSDPPPLPRPSKAGPNVFVRAPRNL